MDNHILITHFNLEGLNGFENLYKDPSWLELRLNIFKKYTLPSLSNQTDSGFHLVMFCHTNTPEPYKTEFLNLEKEYSFLKLIWDQTHFTGLGGSVPSFYNSIKSAYLEVRNNISDEVICSKIGTDDLVETRYNEFIKSSLSNGSTLSLARGLYWDINQNKFLDSTFPTGPFISVKSTLSDFKGDMRELSHHDVIPKTQGIIANTELPLWIQLIHGTNVWNQLNRMPGHHIDPPNKDYLAINFGYKD